MIEIINEMRILFNGDSITDAGRDRNDVNSLSGYNRIIAEQLESKNVACFNRGISGDCSSDLLARIERDLTETKPDLVSFLIGVNDTWRRYDSCNRITTPAEYEKNYRAILSITRQFGAKIIVMEPFLLPVDPAKAIFREDLDFKIDVARSLAREYAEAYVPLDGLFAEAVLHTLPENFSADGVHPSENGNRKIAEWWLQRVKI